MRNGCIGIAFYFLWDGFIKKECDDDDDDVNDDDDGDDDVFFASETGSMFLYCRLRRLRRLSFRAFDEIRKRSLAHFWTPGNGSD